MPDQMTTDEKPLPLWLNVAFWLDEHLLHPLHYLPFGADWLLRVCYWLERRAGFFGDDE